MVATDGHRLALVRMIRPETSGTAVIDALIPKKAMVEAAKIAREELGDVRIRSPTINHLTTRYHHPGRALDRWTIPKLRPGCSINDPSEINIAKDVLHGALRRTSAIMGGKDNTNRV